MNDIDITQLVRLQDFTEMKDMANWPKDDPRGIEIAVLSYASVIYRPDSIDITVHEHHQRYWGKSLNGKWQKMKYENIISKFNSMEWKLESIANRVECGTSTY